jgi:hypothetical protein
MKVLVIQYRIYVCIYDANITAYDVSKKKSI